MSNKGLRGPGTRAPWRLRMAPKAPAPEFPAPEAEAHVVVNTHVLIPELGHDEPQADVLLLVDLRHSDLVVLLQREHRFDTLYCESTFQV